MGEACGGSRAALPGPADGGAKKTRIAVVSLVRSAPNRSPTGTAGVRIRTVGRSPIAVAAVAPGCRRHRDLLLRTLGAPGARWRTATRHTDEATLRRHIEPVSRASRTAPRTGMEHASANTGSATQEPIVACLRVVLEGGMPPAAARWVRDIPGSSPAQFPGADGTVRVRA
jgi:hypothetical protein